MSSKLYEQAQQAQGAAGAGADTGAGAAGSGASDDNVVDADYEVVDEEDK